MPAMKNIGMRKNAKLPRILGSRIQKYRLRRGLSQEDVAFKVGISRVYMGYIEQGRNVPSLEILQKIARVIGVNLKELV